MEAPLKQSHSTAQRNVRNLIGRLQQLNIQEAFPPPTRYCVPGVLWWKLPPCVPAALMPS